MAKKNSNSTVLSTLVFIVLILALLSVGVTFYKYQQFNEKITGYATATGYVNLTVSSL